MQAVRGTTLLVCLLSFSVSSAQQAKPPERYEVRREHDPNGIGKFYMGREIAQVMGHEAAGWLERPEREQEERPSKVIEVPVRVIRKDNVQAFWQDLKKLRGR